MVTTPTLFFLHAGDVIVMNILSIIVSERKLKCLTGCHERPPWPIGVWALASRAESQLEEISAHLYS